MTDKESLVHNVWYMAGWSHEVADKPMSRKILGVKVVMFRGEDGKVVALEDRCCHRGLPLSLGRIKGNGIQCGYHGLCFDGDGRCIHIPGQDRIPSSARVAAFPLVERDAALWIWMGEPDRADATRIVGNPRHDDPNWIWGGEHIAYEANHLLLYDNLLDLTHVGYVHPFTIGGNEAAHSGAQMTVARTDGGLKGVRWMRNVKPPAAYLAIRQFAGNVDRWQVIRFAPGVVHISAGAKDAGTAVDEEDFSDAFETHGFHAVTPETESTTHYFWSAGLPRHLDREGMLEKKLEMARITFEEDRVVLEAQYRNHAEMPSGKFVDIRSDAMGLAARRLWQALADEEIGAAHDLAPSSSFLPTGGLPHVSPKANERETTKETDA